MIGWASRTRPTAAGNASSSASSTARLRTPCATGLRARQAERRQQRRAQGHADDAQRQLHQPVGVEQVGDRAGRQMGREPAADQQVDLHHTDPDDPGPINASSRLTGGRQAGHGGAGARPARAAAKATQASCNAPRQQHPKPAAGSRDPCAPGSAAGPRWGARFSSTGAKAAAAKRRPACSMPLTSAASEMNSR